jgi:hypothetical protein
MEQMRRLIVDLYPSAKTGCFDVHINGEMEEEIPADRVKKFVEVEVSKMIESF